AAHLSEERVLYSVDREQRLAARGIDAGDQRVIGAVLGEHDGGTLTHVALLHRLADVVQRHRPVHIEECAVLPEHIEELAKILVRHRSSPVLARIAAMSYFGETDRGLDPGRQPVHRRNAPDANDVYLHLARKRRSFPRDRTRSSGSSLSPWWKCTSLSSMSDLEEKNPSVDFRFIGKPFVRKEDERLT